MALIDDLQKKLNVTNQVALQSLSSLEPNAMQQEQEETKAWILHLIGMHAPAQHLVIASLRRFWETKRITSLIQARHICHGCLIQYMPHVPYLIEDLDAFPYLLNYIRRYHHRARIFRRCFQGLLSAYFHYEPGIYDPQMPAIRNRDNGWKNRLLLRDFLNQYQSCIHTSRFNPNWVKAVGENPNLFLQHPCQSYVDAALENDYTSFHDVCKRLNIPSQSWFSRSLIYEQVDKIITKNDTDFRHHLTQSLKLISKNRWAVNKSLTKLINRYAESEVIENNADLRQFSISQWRNPWLAENQKEWKSVSEKAKNMVSLWTKQYLIRQFFWMLAQGTQLDVRRAEFWMSFQHKIDSIYFALSPSASSNSSRDFVEMRKTLEGHLLGIEHTTHLFDNACIFMMGTLAIVEFGDNRIPAYVYDKRTSLPFEIKRGFKIKASDLRNRRAAAFVTLLEHTDTNEAKWETTFETFLSQRNIKR